MLHISKIAKFIVNNNNKQKMDIVEKVILFDYRANN